jgi:CRP/FNR family cyclic AMP-dependent transcriptional regulator
MSGDRKLELLAKVPMFGTCSRKSLEAIGSLVDEVDIRDGQVLLHQGDLAHEFFLVLDGQVRIERDGEVLAELGPGEFFGEIALIDHGPRTASAKAIGAGRVGVLGPREFSSLIGTHPDIRSAVLHALARRVRHLEPGGLE